MVMIIQLFSHFKNSDKIPVFKNGLGYFCQLTLHDEFSLLIFSRHTRYLNWLVHFKIRNIVYDLIYIIIFVSFRISDSGEKPIYQVKLIFIKLMNFNAIDIWSHHFIGNRWGNSGNSVRLYFWGGSKITAVTPQKESYDQHR